MSADARRPRVLMLTSTLPRWTGDAEPGFILDLARELNTNFEIQLIAPHAPGAARTEPMQGVPVTRFRAGYAVSYVPIRDGIRFLLIIFRVGTLYSPLKTFLPIATVQGLFGLGYYAHTYFTSGRLTLGTILMRSWALTMFLIGLVSERITQLMYKGTSGGENSP